MLVLLRRAGAWIFFRAAALRRSRRAGRSTHRTGTLIMQCARHAGRSNQENVAASRAGKPRESAGAWELPAACAAR
ncbi:MAG TPA: hypothetical protein VJ757_05810 [Pseudonocardiaceae bacterium]|nr:hypothetical protein [Pseudonocardiaceae bacterium]